MTGQEDAKVSPEGKDSLRLRETRMNVWELENALRLVNGAGAWPEPRERESGWETVIGQWAKPQARREPRIPRPGPWALGLALPFQQV